MTYIDLAFRLNGAAVPVDHGYALYAALSRIVPEIHAAKEVGVQPIRGVYNGNGKLHLSDFSHLILRLPDEQSHNTPAPSRDAREMSTAPSRYSDPADYPT